ncbi:hypothetical protein DPMN_048205 [Dreissena polymorpha]|uniref:Uncharacterized protein n=1 Tax=Dreissena polymorpha TaxID=45954 RepID=A0A9D4DAC5_DREPO|nr:hypothetical protein DPMN_048205 [Dreissena polymorpha]
MRSKQDVLDEQLVAEEREAKVLDVFPPEMVEDEVQEKAIFDIIIWIFFFCLRLTAT